LIALRKQYNFLAVWFFALNCSNVFAKTKTFIEPNDLVNTDSLHFMMSDQIATQKGIGMSDQPFSLSTSGQ
jgi:hypothetical protein